MSRNLVYISDGTLSSLRRGAETNVGLLFRLLEEMGQRPGQQVDYDRGVQGRGWRRWWNAASGLGINRSIRRGYAFLAQRYRPGDRIFLFGYSRGAYAVRSLAGMIGRVGLLRPEAARERAIRAAFEAYRAPYPGFHWMDFARRHCHLQVPIEVLGCFDTVRALGLPYPVLSYLASAGATAFHDHALGPDIRHGLHALGVDEDRTAFAPVLWKKSPDWEGRLEQVWFPGSHGDVGGELRVCPEARPLGNIPLNWMLSQAESLGLRLPEGWQERFPTDPSAPMMGPRRGIARFFLLRRPRRIGRGDGEMLHLSIRERMAALPGYTPRAVSTGPRGDCPSRTRDA